MNSNYFGSDKFKTTVIVCTRNREQEIIRFLNSLSIQTNATDELIIIDSSDNALNKNAIFKKSIRDLPSETQYKYILYDAGLTEARNKGIDLATGDLLFFFDDDVILEPEYLKIMKNTFSEHPEYMGGMGTFNNFPEFTTNEYLKNLFKKVFLLQHDYGSGKFQKSGLPCHPFGTDGFLEVEVLGGALMAYRKETFDEFHFDESLKGYSYMEDADISRRVSYKYKLFFNPEARLEHRHGEGGRGNIHDRKQMYMVNHRYFFFKNFYPRNKFLLIPHWWSIIGLLIKSIFFDPKGSFQGSVDGLIKWGKKE